MKTIGLIIPKKGEKKNPKNTKKDDKNADA